ncbi:MAG: hypothetical protein HC915_16235 [Anaerolineae bacterium]|nr:hypothetical protein [Anaerolineae bacterium]
MSEERNSDKTRRANPEGYAPRISSDELPRRGYDRRAEVPPPSAVPQAPPDYRPKPGAPPPPVRGKRGRRVPRESGLYLPWWSLLVLILFVGAVAFGLLALALSLSGASLGSATPQVIIVTNTQALGAGPGGPLFGEPTALPTTPPATSVDLSTLVPTRTPLPGGCLLNAEVVVFWGRGLLG